MLRLISSSPRSIVPLARRWQSVTSQAASPTTSPAVPTARTEAPLPSYKVFESKIRLADFNGQIAITAPFDIHLLGGHNMALGEAAFKVYSMPGAFDSLRQGKAAFKSTFTCAVVEDAKANRASFTAAQSVSTSLATLLPLPNQNAVVAKPGTAPPNKTKFDMAQEAIAGGGVQMYVNSLGQKVYHDTFTHKFFDFVKKSEPDAPQSTQRPTSRFRVEVSLPPQIQLTVRTTGTANVVSNQINSPLSVLTEGGDVLLGSMQSSKISVSTVAGSVVGANVVGDLSVSSVSGKVTLGKVQGNVIVNSQTGSISAKVVYANKATFCSDSSITLGDVHGSVSCVSNTGEIKVGTISDSLDVRSGEGLVEVQLPSDDFTRVNLVSATGNVVVFCPENAKAQVMLRAQTMRIDPAVEKCLHANQSGQNIEGQLFEGSLNQGGTGALEVNATGGNLSLQTRSWEASLSLASSSERRME